MHQTWYHEWADSVLYNYKSIKLRRKSLRTYSSDIKQEHVGAEALSATLAVFNLVILLLFRNFF